jgi:hypothetical protein
MRPPMTAIECLLEIADRTQDEGPDDEGWQSDRLVSAIADVTMWLNVIKEREAREED